MRYHLKKVVFFTLVFIVSVFSCAIAQEQELIQLPKVNLKQGKRLMETLQERKSTRSFSSKDLSEEVIGNLLWAADGVNRSDSGKKTAPSAKNLQEIDIYVALQKGLYLYDASRHALRLVKKEDIREFTGKQSFTQQAPLNLIYVADYSRMDMGEEMNQMYAAAHTGFISQNVYLFCASQDLATVVLGWIDKKLLSEKMGLKENQRIVFSQPVGYFSE